jgi:hypothetical protein
LLKKISVGVVASSAGGVLAFQTTWLSRAPKDIIAPNSTLFTNVYRTPVSTRRRTRPYSVAEDVVAVVRTEAVATELVATVK